LPERDQYSLARDKLESNLVVAMGGRIAEELMFGHAKVTTGASSDIAHATKTARNMVTVWGMSDKLGPLLYNDDQGEVFLGHSVTQTKSVSAATAELIDSEVRRIVDEAYETCKTILTENKNELLLLGEALLEYETLTGEEINAVIAGETIVRNEDDATPTQAKPSVPSSGNVGVTPDPKPQPGS
ncbi:MAG: cell division protein FtsH, partial [Alphaproteobacteria bacterium]|nr:cell division protein FtsH [Alphaproteobacteria bacterium]